MIAAADDGWIQAAMADDAMVVDLLFTLHRSTPPLKRHTLPPLEWTVRQRRSKSVSISNNDNNSNYPNKSAHRASPTTQLSWSGATSFSGGSAEECSRPMAAKTSSVAGSKVNMRSKKNATKRSRKKTLPELKEEEISLMKERRELKKELAVLRRNLEGQRATNERLKKIKIELQPRLELTSGSPHSLPCPIMDSKFVVPDLNVPFDEPNRAITCEVR